jgi:7 transmembrane sweet-taste receptor of 3 GCPR
LYRDWRHGIHAQYVRQVISVEVDDVNHVTTVNSRGSCSMVDGPSIWAFVGPIVGIHFLLMVGTNIVLYSIRNMDDRYQEGKYVGLASLFVCEVLVIGLPVVISVNENPAAMFIVLSGIIALSDIGMLCFVFLPKIKFQRKGFEEGVKFGETILKKDHKKATQRESVMRSCSFLASSAPMASKASWGGLSHSTGDGLSAASLAASSFEAMPSIVDEEVEESEDESSNEQVELEHAVRTKWNARASSRPSFTAKPAIQTGDDGCGMTELREKYEEVVLKNYGLELEMKEISATEEGLRKRVEELETLVDKCASFLQAQSE